MFMSGGASWSNWLRGPQYLKAGVDLLVAGARPGGPRASAGSSVELSQFLDLWLYIGAFGGPEAEWIESIPNVAGVSSSMFHSWFWPAFRGRDQNLEGRGAGAHPMVCELESWGGA